MQVFSEQPRQQPDRLVQQPEQKIPSLFSHPFILCIVGLALFGALLTGQRELAALALMIAVLMGAAAVWTRLAPGKLSCSLSVDQRRVYPGERLVLRAVVGNAKLLPVHVTLRLSQSDVIMPLQHQPDLRQTGSLAGFRQARFEWEFLAGKRGIHAIGPPELSAGDLLGYYHRDVRAGCTLEVVVFPRLVALKPLRFLRTDLYGAAGKSGMVPDPLYVAGTRDYQAGTPARFIHWKASARRRRVQEKVHDPSFQEKLLVLIHVDGFASEPDDPAFERTLEVAASLFVRMHAEGRPIGLAANAAVPGGGPVVISPRVGDRQLTMLMESLAGMSMKPAGSISSAFESMAPLPWGMTCLLFTRDEGGEAAAFMRSLRAHRVPGELVVCGGRYGGTEGGAEERGFRVRTLSDFLDREGAPS